MYRIIQPRWPRQENRDSRGEGGLRTNFLPKRILKEANIGWETAEARRKLLPVQKASMDEPLSSEAMVGRAKARHAASRDTQTLTTISDPNANLKALEGRHPNSTSVARLGFSRVSLQKGNNKKGMYLGFLLQLGHW